MTLTMVLLSLMIFVATAACEYKTAMGTPADYAYPYYALRYVSLGDYKQQANQAAYNRADQQGYLRYVTYVTDGSNIYRTIIRMKPGSNPNPTWARLPAMSLSSQANKDAMPISAKLSTTEARSLENEDSTADSLPTPIHDEKNQAILSAMESSSILLNRGKSNDAIEIPASLLQKSDHDDFSAEVLPELQESEIISKEHDGPINSSEKIQHRRINNENSEEQQMDMKQQTMNEEIHPSEDSIPITTTMKSSEIGEEEVSTLEPFPEELSMENEENAETLGEESRENKVVAVPQEKEEISGNDLTAEETFSPRYISTPYGPLAVYPLGYQPYPTQRRQMMRPMSGSIQNQNLSVYQTSTTSMENNPSKTLTTMKPAMVGSSLPSVTYSTGSPMQISYAYPYMRYNGQGAVIYQVPQQQYKSNQQYLGWPGVSQTSYQSTYPQGYMSYQPSVLAVRSVPYTQSGGMKVKH